MAPRCQHRSRIILFTNTCTHILHGISFILFIISWYFSYMYLLLYCSSVLNRFPYIHFTHKKKQRRKTELFRVVRIQELRHLCVNQIVEKRRTSLNENAICSYDKMNSAKIIPYALTCYTLACCKFKFLFNIYR